MRRSHGLRAAIDRWDRIAVVQLAVITLYQRGWAWSSFMERMYYRKRSRTSSCGMVVR